MSGLLVGIDEVGRGPLAGPVVAAAVVLDPALPVEGLADSKVLTPQRREVLAAAVRARALAWGLGEASVDEIDRLNVRGATFLAMRRAFAALQLLPVLERLPGGPGPRVLPVHVDGRDDPGLPDPRSCRLHVVPRIGGDGEEPAIAAASIVAKVARDAWMIAVDRRWPGYGFAAHKGYASAAHREALQRLGPCPIHRRTFAPVASAGIAPLPGTASETP